MSEEAAAKVGGRPPDAYNITIIIESPDDGTEMKVEMPGIRRADILAPGYPAQGIAKCVKQFEYMVFGDEGTAHE